MAPIRRGSSSQQPLQAKRWFEKYKNRWHQHWKTDFDEVRSAQHEKSVMTPDLKGKMSSGSDEENEISKT